ncbi:MAG: GNAT family N-acetyltransferase [Roseburia sp.]|nr:GNAT family N-acetyltransferase [Roseburia sp.]
MTESLRFADACTDEHFRAMSLIHALGWRDTYADALPADYMAREITDGRWVDVFRKNYEEQNGVRGLLLCRRDTPVSCLNYCRARTTNYNPGDICTFDNAAYADWGEIASFYTHSAERGKGYGGLLLEEALRRLKADGFENAFVFVLRENEKARRFYAAHGFTWDGTHAEIPFPPDTVCVDLRYVRKL